MVWFDTSGHSAQHPGAERRGVASGAPGRVEHQLAALIDRIVEIPARRHRERLGVECDIGDRLVVDVRRVAGAARVLSLRTARRERDSW